MLILSGGDMNKHLDDKGLQGHYDKLKGQPTYGMFISVAESKTRTLFCCQSLH